MVSRDIEMDPSSGRQYAGHRILEAMQDAVLYSETILDKLTHLEPQRAAKILDFGAGDGLFLRKLRARGISVDCFEPDLILQDNLRAAGARVVYSNTGEIASSAYDLVYTINVLEHISDSERICAELFRIMSPDGRLFVFVPAFQLLWTKLDDEVGHVRRFSHASLEQTLTQSGFIVTSVEYFDCLGFPAALGVRLFEKFDVFRYNAANIRFYDRYIFPLSRRLDLLFKRILERTSSLLRESRDKRLEPSGCERSRRTVSEPFRYSFHMLAWFPESCPTSLLPNQ